MSAKERITVVGAGVIGLTTAVRLLETGFKVEVVADRRHPRTTGNLAAGLWYPYKVGGAGVERWALASLGAYQALAADDETGVRLTPCTSFVPEDDPRPFWADAGVEYHASTERASARTETAKSYRATLPVAEPGLFLPWLESRIETLGGALRLRKKPLEDLEQLTARCVVNCTGLGARSLCRDESVVPIRGTVVRMAGTGIDACVTDDTDPDRPTYIIPNRKYCVLGGSAEPDRWDVAVTEEETRDIVERCAALDERVRRGRILSVAAGLRPGRPEIRLETQDRENGRFVVHNYGHGGSGFTLAWGCADEVVEIVSERS